MTTAAQRIYTDYSPEGYGPISFQDSSPWAGQTTRKVTHEKIISKVSVAKTTTVCQERYDNTQASLPDTKSLYYTKKLRLKRALEQIERTSGWTYAHKSWRQGK